MCILPLSISKANSSYPFVTNVFIWPLISCMSLLSPDPEPGTSWKSWTQIYFWVIILFREEVWWFCFNAYAEHSQFTLGECSTYLCVLVQRFTLPTLVTQPNQQQPVCWHHFCCFGEWFRSNKTWNSWIKGDQEAKFGPGLQTATIILFFQTSDYIRFGC